MAKRVKKSDYRGKLLDQWEKPADSGDPVGCLCSSFTFHSDLFEEECLGRFLGLDSDAIEESELYALELDSRLSQMGKAVIFVDSRHSKGPKSPRWSMIPVHLPGASFHPKIQILIWEKAIRVIIGSANITNDGYRYNDELFISFDYSDGAPADRELLVQFLDFYASVLLHAKASGDVKAGVSELIKRARSISKDWEFESPEKVFHFIPILPGGKSAFEQLQEIQPKSAKYHYAYVESPSFDLPGTDNEPAEQIWNLLKERGDVRVYYQTRGRQYEEQNEIEIFAPQSLLHAKPKKESAEVAFFLADELVNNQVRPMHSKMLQLSDDRWFCYLMGSSNFSSLGLGLKKARKSNIEANVAVIIDTNSSDDASYAKNIDAVTPEGIEIDLEGDYTIKWLPEKSNFDGDLNQSGVPSFISHIEFKKDKNSSNYEIGLTDPNTVFAVYSPNEQELYRHSDDKTNIIIPSASPYPSSFLTIKWDQQTYDFPVSIASQEYIPPNTYLSNLALEEITQLLSSNLSLQKALKRVLAKKMAEENKVKTNIYDPHKRVNTSEFILQKTRLFSQALRALKCRIEAPVYSYENLNWRLKGPLGINSVKNALITAFPNSEEKAFVLNEIIFCLKGISPKTEKGSLPSHKVTDHINKFTEELNVELKDLLKQASPALKKYSKECELFRAK